jgi:tetratricopeptide (TPR) repeat protein
MAFITRCWKKQKVSKDRIAALEAMLGHGQDNKLLRLTLGQHYFDADQYDTALLHLKQALAQDPDYSAAWKLYGKVLAAASRPADAIAAYRQGIDVAEARGDKQAAKEMHVFLSRLQKNH